MSKYHVLKNCDFHNQFDDEDGPTASNISKMRTLTDNHNLTDADILKHDKYHQQQTFQNQYFGPDHHDDNNHNYNNWNSHVENLFQYHNSDMINNTEETETTADNNIFLNSNNLITPLDFSAADENTMEIPLLLQNCGNNKNDESRRNNNNKHLYENNFICLCQQKGFAFNLSNDATRSAKSKILWAIALCCIFMVVEFLGGYIAGSLAIMTDAAHLASDCISFVIGLIAIWLGCKPPDTKMSFGYKRFEVMGAIVSILGIWILTATLVLVAIQRIYSNDYDLDANTMMTISGIGILINIIMIFILHTPVFDLPAGSIGTCHAHNHIGQHGHSHSHNNTAAFHRCNHDSEHIHTELATRSLLPNDRNADVGAATDAIDTDEATSIELSTAQMNGNLLKYQQDGKEKNLNLRAAMIHVIGDLVQSFGVFLAAVLIKIFPKAAFLDPLCTLLFSVIVITTTINLFKESMHLVMDSVPQGISLDNLEMDLLNIEGVKSVHHLNVWNHTSNFSILMVHLIIEDHQTIELIDHKFLVVVHTHMECDTVHSQIEKKKKKCVNSIHHPHDWATLIATTNHKYNAIEMVQDQYFDFGSLLKNKYTWRNTNTLDILTDSNTVLMKATHLAGSAKYNIKHSTIQIERLTS